GGKGGRGVGVADARAGRGGHPRLAVDDARDGLDAHAGNLGDVRHPGSLLAHSPTRTAPVIIPTTASRVVSFVVSVRIVRPSRSTVIRSETATTSGRLWLIVMIARPWLRTSWVSSSTP